MRSKLTLLLFIVLVAPLLSYAQGCITVFSEDGDPFYLVLNGVKQNSSPQTNVHIDGLPNEFYSAKILFADAKKGDIAKNIPVKDQATGQFADVTYKIKTGKDGSPKLRFFGATPVQPNYNPPADMYVVHYGQPAPQQNTVTQTTVTTTTNNGNGNGSISIGTGMGGANLNINVNDPNTTVQQTTTTTTYSQSSDNVSQPATIQQSTGCNYPMPFQTYKEARESVKKATFEETKLSTAKAVLAGNCISTDQVMDMCRQFTFEASKLDFAKFAYSKTTDPGNYFKVGNVFTYDASKTELNNYISNK